MNNPKPTAGWWLLLLITFCGSLAPALQVRLGAYSISRSGDHGLLETMLGSSRQLFSSQLNTQADVYLHRGFYPSFFDQAAMVKAVATTGTTNAIESHDHDHADADGGPENQVCPGDFLQKPHNWIDRFGRNFINTKHLHSEGGEVREVLPWLKMAAELDPHRVETFTVTAYWLRRRLNNSPQAEAMLREGLRANPGHPELLFELGCVYEDDRHDIQAANNIWLAALRKWRELEQPKKEPDERLLGRIAMRLALLQKQAGHRDQAIEYLNIVKSVSPEPKAIQVQIDALRATP